MATSQDPITNMLQHQPAIILDGAMGTELERRGIDLTCSRLWSAQLLIDNPSVIRDIHLDYLTAGADIITTSTYQASLSGFESAGLSTAEAHDTIRLAVQLASEARDQFWQSHQEHQQQPLQQQAPPQSAPTVSSAAGPRPRQRPLVGFSAGSYGAILCDGSEFTGTYAETMSMEQLAAWHLERLEPVLGCDQIDLICFETVPCLLEVQAICHLLKTHPGLSGTKAWVSCSCRDGRSLRHGESFAQEVIPQLWACDQVVACGINCTDPQYLTQLLCDAKAAIDDLGRQRQSGQGPACGRTAGPPVLLCYPNSGETWDGERRCWHCDASALAAPERFAAAAADWVAAGARMLGGCCRTSPAHITAVRERLLLGGK